MDVLVEMAIDLACQLQEDERYLAVQKAQAEADADAALQDMIGEFNLKRMAINQEESKPEEQQDATRLRTLNTELPGMSTAALCKTRIWTPTMRPKRPWIPL